MALSEKNGGLEVLILNYCSNISDSAIIKSISYLSRLKKLGLHVSDSWTKNLFVYDYEIDNT